MAEHLCIATVELETDHQHYPVKVAGRTIFPVGRFTTTLTTPDLRHALDHGRILRVLEYAKYNGAHLFDSFVDDLWLRRRRYVEQEDPFRAKLLKLWMVTLYGAWGTWQHEHQLVDVGEGMPDNIDLIYDSKTGLAKEAVVLGGTMYSESKSGTTMNGFPAIMAHIAAYGRQRMWSLAANAGRGHVYFVLADGLIVDQIGYERLLSQIDAHDLGKLKESDDGRALTIHSDTELVLGDHVWRSGVPGNASEIEPGVFVADVEPHGAYGLHDAEDHCFSYTHRTYQLARQILTGNVTSNGWIEPIYMLSSLPERSEPGRTEQA